MMSYPGVRDVNGVALCDSTRVMEFSQTAQRT
jgi:hypothetical protein